MKTKHGKEGRYCKFMIVGARQCIKYIRFVHAQKLEETSVQKIIQPEAKAYVTMRTIANEAVGITLVVECASAPSCPPSYDDSRSSAAAGIRRSPHKLGHIWILLIADHGA